jgi:hypothetical protein
MAEMDFNEFARKTLERADRLIRAVGIKTFSAVIRDTPVGNPDLWKSSPPKGYVGGRLRANWRCSLQSADTTTDESTEHARALPAVLSTCESANRKSVLWLSNSLPYAYRIEYEGHSRQAPSGMVRRNTERVKRIISTELRKMKS